MMSSQNNGPGRENGQNQDPGVDAPEDYECGYQFPEEDEDYDEGDDTIVEYMIN